MLNHQKLKALIPAAGLGSRLRPLTQKLPKAMLTVGKQTIIQNIIAGLIDHDVRDITVVIGYHYQLLLEHIVDCFPGAGISFIFNPRYVTLNNIYSVHLAAPSCRERDLFIINADLFCERELIVKALEAPLNTMIIDPDADLTEEATKVQIDETGCISRIDKRLGIRESQGEYVGIMKLACDQAGLYFDQVALMIARGDTGVWYPYALDELISNVRIEPVFTGGLVWEEIDTPEDYFRACSKAVKQERN